jgi:hypothetical protein
MICCLASTAAPAPPPNTCDTGGWELVMDKNGIKAYSRKVENSGIFEFRAVMVAEAPAEVVAEVLRDVPADTQWLPYCNEAVILEKKDDNNFTTYFSFDLPWPVTDRDLIMETTTAYDFDHARAVSNLYRAEAASRPPKDSHLRVPAMTGQFVFEFVTRQRTGIVHTYRIDLGGSIPEWMANYSSQYNIYNTFMNMKEMFKKEKYIELGKTSPDRELCEQYLADRQRVKSVLVARLREFIRDSDFVDMIRDSPAIDDVIREDNGAISETLLYGWGSDESKKKAVRVVLKIMLSGATRDEQLVRTILHDDNLADIILCGPYPGGKTARQIIDGYLKNAAKK